MNEWMNNFTLKRVKTHDSNITENPVALIVVYNIYKLMIKNFVC
jgi:hypothetical protein